MIVGDEFPRHDVVSRILDEFRDGVARRVVVHGPRRGDGDDREAEFAHVVAVMVVVVVVRVVVVAVFIVAVAVVTVFVVVVAVFALVVSSVIVAVAVVSAVIVVIRHVRLLGGPPQKSTRTPDLHTVLVFAADGASMKAVQFTEHGGTEVIEYGDFPDPEPERDEVLVDVKAGALNHLDVWTRRGLPGITLDMPHIPGSDGAGEVVDVGEDVTRFEPGDRVALSAGVSCGKCEFCRHGEHSMCVNYHIIGEHVRGVHSELAAVPEDNLLSVPEGVSWETAAAAPLVFQTAWRMLITRADVTSGEHVLVLGASGGVGHAAVQIADYAGATVYATGSSEAKLEHARELGADHVIDYEAEDFASQIRELTGGRGVDVVVDHIGKATWQDSLKSLAKGGRIVTCGATTGGQPETDINRIFWNQLSVIGSTMASLGEADDVMELVWDGTFEPAIREVLPMSETARAHEMLENREGFGKVVVKPDSEL